MQRIQYSEAKERFKYTHQPGKDYMQIGRSSQSKNITGLYLKNIILNKEKKFKIPETDFKMKLINTYYNKDNNAGTMKIRNN